MPSLIDLSNPIRYGDLMRWQLFVCINREMFLPHYSNYKLSMYPQLNVYIHLAEDTQKVGIVTIVWKKHFHICTRDITFVTFV